MINTTGLTVTADPAVPAATGAVTTNGATAAGTPNTVTTVDAGILSRPVESVTVNRIDANVASGEVNVTDDSNWRYVASDAAPVNVTDDVPALNPVVEMPPGSEPKPKTCPTAGSLIVTVAEPNCEESRSVMSTTGLTVIGDPAVPAATGVVTTNGAMTAGILNAVTTVDAGILSRPVESVTVKRIDVRVASGEVNVTDPSN